MSGETGLVLVAVVVAAAVIGWLVQRAVARRDDGGGVLLLQQQLDALRGQVQQSLAGQGEVVGQQLERLTQQLNERLHESVTLVQQGQHAVGERLDNATKVVAEVHRGLGELREATARVHEVGRDVALLHDILKAPKLRGGLGEFLLGDLLSQVLPAAHFELQYGFRSGERVDAVVRLGDALVPIDSKFPLEDFRRLLAAADDAERARARKAFLARVKKHIDDIAAKYIRPDEQTYDFALMYVPAENVYYETIIREETGEEAGLVDYALARKVVPVSPNSLYAYLQAIVHGLKGMRIEARAQQMMGELARLTGELGRLRDEMRLVGKHLGNAQQAFGAADRRLERVEAKLAAAVGEPADGEVPQLPLLGAGS